MKRKRLCIFCLFALALLFLSGCATLEALPGEDMGSSWVNVPNPSNQAETLRCSTLADCSSVLDAQDVEGDVRCTGGICQVLLKTSREAEKK